MHLVINQGVFQDEQGRTVILRGINLAGDSKIPNSKGTYIDRPFSLKDADDHLLRIKNCGFNTIRYIFTWDALEHDGPGTYDDQYIDFTIAMLRKIHDHGFHIFMDPHQDVWSWYSGGSGAPLWTLYLAGFDPDRFVNTHAAVVQRDNGAIERTTSVSLMDHTTAFSRSSSFSSSDSPDLPGNLTIAETIAVADAIASTTATNDNHHKLKMLWSSNYHRLVCQTMFTLFYAGEHFAPKCTVCVNPEYDQDSDPNSGNKGQDNTGENNNYINIGKYMSQCFLNAIRYFAEKIVQKGASHLILGWETLNEPSGGYIGIQDITLLSDALEHVKLGTCPTPLEGMLLGNAIPCLVPMYEFSRMGPKKVGITLIQPESSVWLSSKKLQKIDQKYGWKRSWEVGCIWELHGVYDKHRLQKLMERTASTTSLSSMSSTTSTPSERRKARRQVKRELKGTRLQDPHQTSGSPPSRPGQARVLRPDYFAYDKTGKPLGPRAFVDQFFVEHFYQYQEMIRNIDDKWWIFVQPPVNSRPPDILDIDATKTVYSPHHYDGLTLMTKKWTSFNVDAVGILRKQYLSPVLGVRIGEKAVRNSFCRQLKYLKKEGTKHIHAQIPCLLSEIGIPFDMEGGYPEQKKDNKQKNDKAIAQSHQNNDNNRNISGPLPPPQPSSSHSSSSNSLESSSSLAYQLYPSQTKALDANCWALEYNQLHHTLWVYTASNTHDTGDNWNGEDLSIYSVDDIEYNNGIRAALAVVRPCVRAVSGSIISFGFNLTKCVFALKLECFEPGISELFLPALHFPSDRTGVATTAGTWHRDLATNTLYWSHPKGLHMIEITGVTALTNNSTGTICPLQ